jgi:transposase
MEGCGCTRLDDLFRRVVTLGERNRRLEEQLAASGAALQQARMQIASLEQELQQAHQNTDSVRAQLAEFKEALQHTDNSKPSAVPAFVKANVAQTPKHPPGRKPGHFADHRLHPLKIDVHVDVPAPRDHLGKASCPECHVQLQDVQTHQRIVEDIIPAKRLVTCYHTTSGYCPGCRKRIESRDGNQPPAPPGVEIHQSQLGINSLATAALLRMRYRLPYRQIQQLFLDLPGLSISAGGVTKQIQRMAGWLEGQYDRLKVLIRASPAVHMDETSWRVDGVNHWLWTMLCEQATVFHIDKSRGQKVTGKLLGEHFGGTLVSDFYGAYAKIDCPKQKCLVHLLRELKETKQKHPAFGAGSFYLRLRRLIQEMLLLKKKKPGLCGERHEAKVRRIERRLLELQREPEGGWTDKQAKRLAKRLKGHEGELTVFLRQAEVAGDNNAAERALRPAVVMRKISGGSRSEKGAHATAVLLSVLKTALQQNCPLFETIKTLLKSHWAGENPGLLTDVFNTR